MTVYFIDYIWTRCGGKGIFMCFNKSIEFIETSKGKFAKRNILEVLNKFFCWTKCKEW